MQTLQLLNSTYVMNSSKWLLANASDVYQNSAEGVVSFNITAFDLAGNSLTVNQTQLDSSNLTIDQTNPTLSNLSMIATTITLALATFGDTQTYDGI